MVTNLKTYFGNNYRVTDDNTDDPVRVERVWCQEIRGKHGVIYPYGHNGSLAVRFDSNTKTKTAAWCRRLASAGFKPLQRGDWEVVFIFSIGYFSLFANLIQAKKRRHLSPENRGKALAALEKAKSHRQVLI